MINPFTIYNTDTEIKRLYRQLAMRHHPDLGGCTAEMQELNAFYHAALKRVSGCTFEHNGKEYSYKYNEDTEQAIMDMIQKLLGLRLVDVSVDLIGVWLWVTGDTKPHRETFKELGLKWHSGRSCWFYHTGTWSGRRSRGGLDSLAAKYGVTRFSNREERIS